MKLKIHPLAIPIAVLLIWKFGFVAFFCSVIAVTLHEYCHKLAASGRGYGAGDVLWLPYGAVIYNEKILDKTSNVIIALAGPLANLVFSLVTISFWWIIPESFSYTKDFAYANLGIGLFNLIPVCPLDGARIVSALTGYRPKVQKALRALGVVAGIALAVAYVVSMKTSPNFTLPVMAVFLITANVTDNESNDFHYFANTSPLVKNYDNGVVEKTIYISDKAVLKRILLLIKPDCRCYFKIVDDYGEVIARLDEEEMKNYINSFALNEKIGEVIRRNYRTP